MRGLPSRLGRMAWEVRQTRLNCLQGRRKCGTEYVSALRN
ncbi:hypothetical protein PAMC26510_37270 [Caballeronia sordidicola]|uniref:Uncharacterized protein n=1 Tax=Caballeronia sordidicola TaxID=196367 RepID=A0A242M4X9_CABSO|nr:hypothetical protein PAMC26510_37270 [Caballeronia sordidicola]